MPNRFIGLSGGSCRWRPVFSLFPEKSGDQFRDRAAQGSFPDVHAVRKSGIVLKIVEGSGHSPFGLPDAEHQCLDPGLHDGSKTHETGFYRHIKGSPGDPVVPESLRAVPKASDFGMGRGVAPGDAAVVTPADDLTVEDKDRSDGHLPLLKGKEGFLQGFLHPSFVVASPDAVCVRHRQKGLPLARKIRPVVFRIVSFCFQFVVVCGLFLCQGLHDRIVPVQADPLFRPGDPPVLARTMKESARMILEGHPEQAIPGLVKLERAYPDYAMVHFLLGLAYGKMDQNARAVLEEKKAIVLNPKNEPARVSYGIALGNTGHFRQEIRAEREALSLDSRDELAWESIGWAYASLGKWPLARAAEETALRLRKEDPSARMILGVALAHMGFPEEGLSEEKQAASLDPDDQGVKRAIAWISGILHPLKSQPGNEGHFNPLLSPENGSAPPGLPNPLSSPSQNPAAGVLRAPVVGH